MRRKYLYSNSGMASLIGIFLAMAIMAFLYLTYLRPSQQSDSLKALDEAAEDVGKDANIDTSSHMAVLESTKIAIESINERNRNRGDEMMKEIEAMQQY